MEKVNTNPIREENLLDEHLVDPRVANYMPNLSSLFRPPRKLTASERKHKEKVVAQRRAKNKVAKEARKVSRKG